ncbi:rhomboid family intramembrane serine protease [Streptomyces sp. NPDC048483]|uniref:rhomboid family intramembrane serine protease n=1 Tax=Streptomyces sp. NPDC048483 TaxID=3154927 RepID=UPI00342F8719
MDQVPGSPQEPKDTHDGDDLPACYRHPDRTTGIRCTRCDKPICPDCMVSASVGFQCRDCVRGGGGTGHSATASAPRTIAGGTIAANPRLITLILMGINLAVFVAVKADGTRLLNELVMLGRTPPEYLPQGVAEGEWYRLVTSVFLHQEIPHIAFNMLSLWWLGPPLEAALGRLRFIALYMLSGLGGSALTYLAAAPSGFSLGASGAIFGLLGATAVLMRRLNYDMKPVLILLGLNLVFTFTWPHISWQAHIGGLVVGAAVAYGMVHAPRERRNLVQAATCAVALLAIVAVVWVRTVQLLG